MVDQTRPVADSGTLDALTELFGLVDSGVTGIVVLHRLVEVASGMTGAAGAAFVETGADSARVVAVAAALEWLRGRPISISDPAVTRLFDGPRLLEFDRSDIGGEGALQLAGHGLGRLIRVAAVAGGERSGFLVCGYPEGAPPPTAAGRSAAMLLAGLAAHLYTLGRGLPVDDRRSRGPAAGGYPRRREDRNLFIAVTSHELRTPVTVIRGYADTLTEHWNALDDRARRDAVTVIGQRARDLGRLLDRLLSAAGEGVVASAPAVAAPFDMLDALREAVAELPVDLRRDLRVELPGGLPKAAGDRGTVSMIVTELVTNACKYSPEVVDVELTAGADARVVWVRVADRGVGIRPEHVERAFDRFWQSDAGDRRQCDGVGLGLYLVRRIVERQRGWVSLRPRDDGGTVAEVRLPRADTSPGEA